MIRRFFQAFSRSFNVLKWSETWQRTGYFFCVVCLPLLCIAGLSIFYLDSAAAAYFKLRYGNSLHLWARATTDVGLAEPYFAAAIGLWILFWVLDRATSSASASRWKRGQVWAYTALLSFVTSGVLAQGLKHLFGRKRPYADALLSSHEFHPFTANYEFHSLPSGHSQVLFTAATVLSAIWPRAWWLWLGAAATFSATRAITLNHWVSDVIVGGMVGMLGTVLAFRLLRYGKERMKSSRLKTGAAVLMVAFAPFWAASEGRAESAGPLGVGLIVGDPTGLSANYRLSQIRSIDAALAWSFGSDSGFEMHADYLWHRADLFRVKKAAFDLHYGVGGRFMALSDRHGTDRTRLGVRLPVGLATDFNQRALEVFAELALVMNVIPSTTADLDLGIGARVYF